MNNTQPSTSQSHDADSIETRIDTLKTRESELRARLKSIKEDFNRGLDKDSGERAVQLENAEVLNEIARVTEKELESVIEEIGQLNRNE